MITLLGFLMGEVLDVVNNDNTINGTFTEYEIPKAVKQLKIIKRQV